MSGNEARFGVVLEDGVTAPAKTAQTAMERLKSTIEKFNKTGIGKAVSKMQDWGKQAITIGAAATAAVGAAVVGLTVQTVDFAAKSRIAFDRVAKHGESGEELFQRSIGLAQELGLDVQATAKQMIKFRALQFDQGQAEDLIKMGSDMRSLGASTDQVASIYAQFGQIMSKGRLQGEELTVLAENGISTKLVYENLAKSLGKTVPQIQKLMQSGKITATQGLDAIGAALLQKTHTTAFGQAGKMAADATMSGLLARAQSAGQGFVLKLADSVGPQIMGAFKSILDQVSDFGSEIHLFDRLSDALGLVARIARRAAPLIRDFFEGFASGVLTGVTGALTNVSETLANLNKQDVAKFGERLGTILGQIFELGTRLASFLTFFTTPLGQFVLGVGALVLVGFKVVSIFTSLAPVFSAIGSALVWVGTAIAGVVGAGAAAAAAIAVVAGAVIAAGIAIFVFRDQIAAAFTSAWDAVVGWFERLKAVFTDAGPILKQMAIDIALAIADGFTFGLASKIPSAIAAIKALTGGTVEAANTSLQIHSPSKVFQGIGENVAAGFNMGVATMGIPEINAPSLGADTPTVTGRSGFASSAGLAPSAGAARGDFVFAPNISVPLSGSATKEDGQRFAEGLSDGMSKQFSHFLESLAIEQGG